MSSRWFFMYNYKVLVSKQDVINHIYYSMIPENLCQNNEPVTSFTTAEMRSKCEAFSNKNGCTMSN